LHTLAINVGGLVHERTHPKQLLLQELSKT